MSIGSSSSSFYPNSLGIRLKVELGPSSMTPPCTRRSGSFSWSTGVLTTGSPIPAMLKFSRGRISRPVNRKLRRS